MTTAVNVTELKNRLSEFLAQVERGSALIVCRRNVPVARIEPIPKPHARKPRRRVVGRMKGTAEIIAEALSLPPPIHRDPADRILIATARLEKLTLVTTDATLCAYPHVSTLA